MADNRNHAARQNLYDKGREKNWMIAAPDEAPNPLVTKFDNPIGTCQAGVGCQRPATHRVTVPTKFNHNSDKWEGHTSNLCTEHSSRPFLR